MMLSLVYILIARYTIKAILTNTANHTPMKNDPWFED